MVIDYQLVPHVKYPGGAEDIQAVREWVFNNISSGEYGQGSPQKVVLFGHSSGGAHIATNLYSAGKRSCSQCLRDRKFDLFPTGDSSLPDKDPLFPPVAAVVYIGVPFWFDPNAPSRKEMLREYFGSEADEVWQVMF